MCVCVRACVCVCACVCAYMCVCVCHSMAMDMDYKDKYLRTFAENQKLKKQRNEHLDQIKRKNTEIQQLKEDFKVRLARLQSGAGSRSGKGGKTKTNPLSGEILCRGDAAFAFDAPTHL